MCGGQPQDGCWLGVAVGGDERMNSLRVGADGALRKAVAFSLCASLMRKPPTRKRGGFPFRAVGPQTEAGNPFVGPDS